MKTTKYKNFKTLLFSIVILIIINGIGSLFFYRIDLTKDQRYTLSQTSLQILKEVKEPLIIDVFLQGQFPGEFKKLQTETQQILEEFKAYNKNITFQFVNPIENEEERDLTRQIFNGVYSKNFPASLKESVARRPKKILQLLMASSSGAEGITLNNVRHVHIMEPHWTPSRHDQVIGRAIRICSHATLPLGDRTVKVNFYISVFSDDQKKTQDGPNITPIRRNDMVMKRYSYRRTCSHVKEIENGLIAA
jgi:hypothetical protein